MLTEKIATERDETRLWKYISLNEYSRPAAPPAEAARKGLRYLLGRLRDSDDFQGVNVELHMVSQALLDQVAPPPTWQDVVPALDESLGGWIDNETPDTFLRALVDSPSSGAPLVLRQWAEERNWRIIEPPSYSDILKGGGDWLEGLYQSGGVKIAIPHLEKFYLRHHDGLDLIRSLLDWLWMRDMHCLVECDSFGWAYLSKTISIDSAFPQSITLEAFAADRLQRWFGETSAEMGYEVVFRQSDNGKLVLPKRQADAENEKDEPEEVTDFLKQVAAHSYGIPGIAWAVWRHSLRVSADDLEEAAETAAVKDKGQTIWVRPWDDIALPVMRSGSGLLELFVLQSLLLHDGLPADILDAILPFSLAEVLRALHEMRKAGLVKLEAGIWSVTALGYPAVRRHLNSEGYLVDAL